MSSSKKPFVLVAGLTLAFGPAFGLGIISREGMPFATQRELADLPLSLLDFGADPTGRVPVDEAWRSFIAAMEESGRAGHVPHGRYRFAQQAKIDLAPVANHGLMLSCEGESKTILDVSAVAATPQFLIESSGGGSPLERAGATPKAAFYMHMRSCGIQGHTDDVVLGVGKADLSDQLNGIELDLWVANAGASENKTTVIEINAVFNSTFRFTANGSRSGGRGSSIRLKQSQFSQYFVSAGHAGCAFYMTGDPSPLGYNYANTIISPDFEEVSNDVCIDSAHTARNVFIAGQYVYNAISDDGRRTGAVDASAGDENVLVSPNMSPTAGAISTPFVRRVGITRISGNAIDAADAYRVAAPAIELAGSVTATNNLRVLKLPSSAKGLPSGSLWNNGGVVNVVP